MKKNSKTFFLLWGLFVFLVIINFWGCDKSATSTNHPDPFYQNIDSSVTMIAKINDIPYYGKEYKDPYPPNIWVPITVIEATEPGNTNYIALSRYMITGNEHPFIHYSYLIYQGNNYYLLTLLPYRVIFDSLCDTLISGSFYGTFINDQIADTITIDNGIFTIRPHVPNDFYLSCSLKTDLFESNAGNEYLDRHYKKFETEYDLFEDSTRVIIKFRVGSLDENFTGSYTIWPASQQVFVTVNIREGSTIPKAVYNDYDGMLHINEMITLFETDTITGNIKEIIKVSKATFELQARSDQGEIITITQGEYSYHGFDY